MSEPIVRYDEVSDTLTAAFFPGEKATGIELNESILLRINKRERRAVGLSVFNYSYLAQKTATGMRSLPLTGLADLSEEMRAMVIDILLHPPVEGFLVISTYTPSLSESVPIVSLREEMLQLT